MNQKGNMSLYIMFLVSAMIAITVFVLMIPFTQNMNTKMYEAAEDLLVDANETANDLNNTAVKTALQNSFQAQVDSVTTSNDILSLFFQYSWALVIFIAMIPVFLAARQLVESRRGGGGSVYV